MTEPSSAPADISASEIPEGWKLVVHEPDFDDYPDITWVKEGLTITMTTSNNGLVDQ